MSRLTDFLKSHHAWFAAAGLVGLAVYQLSQEKYADAWTAAVGAAGLLGIHLFPRSLP